MRSTQRDNRASLPVENPATETTAGYVAAHDETDLEAAIGRARAALPSWGSDESIRREMLREVARTLRANAGELAETVTTEQGKPVRNARIEVDRAAAWFDYFAQQPLVTVPPPRRDAEVRVRRRPAGIVAAITPSNYPVLLAAWKLAPALLAGNCVILKPSPATPLATARLGILLNEFLPAGVATVLTGDSALGRAMVAHADVRVVSFTGSPEVGWAIADAVPRATRVILELGGNDPAILLPDADVAGLANALFGAAFLNNGQACIAVKRVYVPERLEPELTEALAHLARTSVVGHGMEPGTRFGPLVTCELRDKVAGLVDDARRRGAAIAAGGRSPDRRGHFYLPTVVARAADDMPIVAEEQFGPALPVVAYSDLASVVSVVNSGRYGLGASVWGSDLDQARAVAARLDCGIRWINCHGRQEPELPFGGRRISGIGVENGTWGIENYSDLAVDYEPRSLIS
jgi:acyl-CoA reductase-like NAD-dependent aldehyde dehydrogenase